MEPPSPSAISILNRSGRRLSVASIRKALSHILGAEASVEVVLVDDAAMADLNGTSRGIAEPTDVLTFPAPSFPGAPLGEIAISVEYAERQAKERGLGLTDELAYLTIHGALHLKGFDDIDEADRVEMFAEMHRIGLELGLPEQPEWTSILKGAAA